MSDKDNTDNDSVPWDAEVTEEVQVTSDTPASPPLPLSTPTAVEDSPHVGNTGPGKRPSDSLGEWIGEAVDRINDDEDEKKKVIDTIVACFQDKVKLPVFLGVINDLDRLEAIRRASTQNEFDILKSDFMSSAAKELNDNASDEKEDEDV